MRSARSGVGRFSGGGVAWLPPWLSPCWSASTCFTTGLTTSRTASLARAPRRPSRTMRSVRVRASSVSSMPTSCRLAWASISARAISPARGKKAGAGLPVMVSIMASPTRVSAVPPLLSSVRRRSRISFAIRSITASSAPTSCSVAAALIASWRVFLSSFSCSLLARPLEARRSRRSLQLLDFGAAFLVAMMRISVRSLHSPQTRIVLL